MITLMEIVHHGHGERMHEHDKTRWKAAMDSLERVWNPKMAVENPPIRAIPPYVDEISTATYHTTHRPSSIGEDARELNRLPKEQLLSYERRYASPGLSSYATPNVSFQSPPLAGHTIPIFQNAGMPGQLDYDILEELSYADSIDVDPHFMTNLGFAPGCDLGEMFQGDFGT